MPKVPIGKYGPDSGDFKEKKCQLKTGFFESAENFELFHSHFSARTDRLKRRKKSRKEEKVEVVFGVNFNYFSQTKLFNF